MDTEKPLGGGLETDGSCALCERHVTLLDGVLCGHCHSEVWASYVDRVQMFALVRTEDESGISGEGVVALGICFPEPNGRVVLGWLTSENSVAVYDDLDAVQRIHGHDGATRLAFF